MRGFELLAERKIREAMDEGLFDDLSGKGRPIDLSENPYEDPSCRLAYRLLRNNGYTLPWIEESRDIARAIDEARAALLDARRRALRSTDAEARWRAAVGLFRSRAAEINRRVLDFNVKAPTRGVELLTLVVDVEVERAAAAAAEGRGANFVTGEGRVEEPKKRERLPFWHGIRNWLGRPGSTPNDPAAPGGE